MNSINIVSAEDIRRLRKFLKLTQKELARKSGLSQSLISRIENKTVDPRLSTIKKIIDTLVQIKQIRTAEDIMHSPVITVDIRDSVRTAVDIMKKHNISQMPVLKGNKIVGSIRETTIINHIIKSDAQKVFSSTVDNIMETKFATVYSFTPLEDVVYLLLRGEPAVLVVNNKLVGIITKIDAISTAINFDKMERRNTK